MTITNTEAVSDERLTELADKFSVKELVLDIVAAASIAAPTNHEMRKLIAELLSRRAANSAGGVEVKADCADEGHDHPSHDWRTACLKCGVFRGSDLYTHPSSPVSAEVTEQDVDRAMKAFADEGGYIYLAGRPMIEVVDARNRMRAALAALNGGREK